MLTLSSVKLCTARLTLSKSLTPALEKVSEELMGPLSQTSHLYRKADKAASNTLTFLTHKHAAIPPVLICWHLTLRRVYAAAHYCHFLVSHKDQH